MTFCYFEKGIDKNMFDLSFLDSYHSKLCCELMQPYDEKKSCIDCFLHQDNRKNLARPSLGNYLIQQEHQVG